jgi:hypothetical protein
MMASTAIQGESMGLLSRLFGDSPKSPAVNTQFAQWREPTLMLPDEEWSRRLRGYAQRCASDLLSRGTPRWQSRFPRAREGTFRDAFWVVSVDVDRADRFYVNRSLGRGTGVKEGDFGGWIQGDALILTPVGGLFSSKCEMWFPPSGNHEEGDLDSIFHAPSLEHLRTSPWAGLNTGRWRKQQDRSAYGVDLHTSRYDFKGRYPAGAWNNDNPGKGTSIALNKFVKSGRPDWPRWFAEYYGR